MSVPGITLPVTGTIVDTFKESFVNVPIDSERDNAVATTQFCDAAESLTSMFDVMGGLAFKPVKSDMMGNITKLRNRQLAFPDQSQSIQDLVRNEIKAGENTASVALTWLIRALDFTCIALNKNIQLPSEELSVSFTDAYAVTLKPHHNWLVKPIFSAAMSAVPYRKAFYAKLGSDPEKVYQELSVYLAALDKIVAIIKGFLDTPEAKW